MTATADRELRIDEELKQWDRLLYRWARRAERGYGLEADDVVQEICGEAIRNWGSYDSRRGAVSTWLGCVARTTISRMKDRVKMHSVKAVSLSHKLGRAGSGANKEDRELEDVIIDPRAPDPVDEADHSFLCQRVDEAINSLRPDEQVLVRETFWEGETIANRDRDRLRHALEKLGDVLDPLEV